MSPMRSWNRARKMANNRRMGNDIRCSVFEARERPILTETDRAARLEYSKRMLAMTEAGTFDHENCLWIKTRVIGSGSISTSMLVGIHFKLGPLGPFFPSDVPSEPGEPEGDITPRKYKILLETKLIPKLRTKLSDAELSTCWLDTADVLSDDCSELMKTIFGDRIMCTAGLKLDDISPLSLMGI